MGQLILLERRSLSLDVEAGGAREVMGFPRLSEQLLGMLCLLSLVTMQNADLHLKQSIVNKPRVTSDGSSCIPGSQSCSCSPSLPR